MLSITAFKVASVCHCMIKSPANLATLPLKITAAYALVGVAWILFSDTGLARLVEDPALLTQVALIKGMLFTFVSSSVLYMLVARAAKIVIESESKYRLLHESLMDAYVAVDMKGRIVDCNESYQTMLGYNRAELDRLTYMDLTPEKWRGFEEDIIRKQIIPNNYSDVYRKEYRRKDGSVFPVELRTSLLRDENGEPSGMWAIVRDITVRVRGEEDLKTSLKEKEALLRELYHRTKNNMQVICSMLALQSSYTQDPEVLDIFKEMENRIHSMTLVHQKLCESHNLASINLPEYIRDLAELLMHSHGVSHGKVELSLDLDEVSVSIDTAVPCGFILNELISNSLKHAFPGHRAGELAVRLTAGSAGEIELCVSDNGVGVPEGFDFRTSGRLGLQSVFAIGEHQLQGQVVFQSDGGLSCKVNFTDIAAPGTL